MADEAVSREEVARIMARPLPPRHALDFYRVLGNLMGLYICLGYDRAKAESAAAETLARCKPDHRKRA